MNEYEGALFTHLKMQSEYVIYGIMLIEEKGGRMIMSRSYLCVLSVLLGNTVVHAEPMMPHWYLGADIGQGYYDNGGNPDAYETDYRDLVAGVHIGYQFNPYFSTELAYQYLGQTQAKYAAGSVEGEFSQGVLSARLGYPLFSGALTPYLSVGGAAWMGNVEGLDAQGWSPVYGGGVAYAFNEHLRFRLEYQWTDSLGDDDIQFSEHQWVAFGVSWLFGHTSPTIREVEVPVERIVEVEKVVEVPVVKQELHILGNRATGALFANNSSQLLTSDALTPILDALLTHPDATAVITGYTDNVGAVQYNQTLSEKRAQAVGEYLVTHGVKEERLSVKGKGIASPIADNKTAEGRAMNRRVEVLLYGKLTK